MTRAYKEGCYICEDPSFESEGLPLCYECKYCQSHVAADSGICDVCGLDQAPGSDDVFGSDSA